MESNNNYTFRIIVIVTLIMILTPVESKCVPLRDSFVARSLLSVLPPESDSPSPSPAPVPEVSPAASPNAPADSISPAESEIDSPVPSPYASDAPAESENDSPVQSPDASVDSISPTESEIDSPVPSPNSPAESVIDSPAPSPDSVFESQNKSDSSVPKTVSKPPLLSLSPEIKSICSQTDYPPLCESSVSPLITPDMKPDTSSVLILAIQATVNETKTAKVTVDKLNAPDCVELYDDAVANLEDAIKAVKARDMPTVDTNLSAAMTDYGTCNDGFEETGEPNPLVDVADKLTKMVSNCLAISAIK